MGLDGADLDGVGDGDLFVGFAFGEEPEDQVFFGGEEGKEVGLGGGFGFSCAGGYFGYRERLGCVWFAGDRRCKILTGGLRLGGPFDQEAGSKEGDGDQGKIIVEFQIPVYDQLAYELEADDDSSGDQTDA